MSELTPGSAEATGHANSHLKSCLRWMWEHAGYLAVLGVFVFICFEHDSISRMGSHARRMILGCVAIAGLHFSWELVRNGQTLRWPWRSGEDNIAVRTKLLFLGLMMSATYGVFNYYQFDRQVFAEVNDYADSTYYYLNSKYFDELGYTHLYEAMLVADNEGAKRFRRIKRYRDLVEYKALYPREVALSRADVIKARFSQEQWEAFKHDLNFITGQQAKGGWGYFFIDHGYNPPPTWTLIGGTLSKLCPVEHMKWITMVDFVLIAIMMLVIGRVFGSFPMLIALLFYCVTFSGRWPVLGQSILRFDWVAALVMAVCALKAERRALAGALLAYAACSRVFPAIFFFPYVVVFLRDVWQTRRISEKHWRFIIGAGATTALLVGTSMAIYGSGTYMAAANNLALHGGPESFSSHRVGLGDALLYRGETSRSEINANGGIDGKREQLWALDPWLKLIGLVSLLWLTVCIWHSRSSPHRLIWLSIFPLFCITNPQINYYNLRLLPLLYHLENHDRYRDRLGLFLLFGIEVATQHVMITEVTRYAVTSTTSIGLLIYLLIMAGFLTADLVKNRSQNKRASEAENAVPLSTNVRAE